MGFNRCGKGNDILALALRSTASFAAVYNGFPIAFPALAPFKRAATRWTHFAGFLHRSAFLGCFFGCFFG
jgi:hypothetical protein